MEQTRNGGQAPANVSHGVVKPGKGPP
jgi:hypothetical protein